MLQLKYQQQLTLLALAWIAYRRLLGQQVKS